MLQNAGLSKTCYIKQKFSYLRRREEGSYCKMFWEKKIHFCFYNDFLRHNVMYKVLFIFSTMIPFLQHFSTVIVPTEKWFLQSLTITKWLDIIFLFKYQKIFWNFTHFKCTQCLMANIGSYYRWNVNFPELNCFF